MDEVEVTNKLTCKEIRRKGRFAGGDERMKDKERERNKDVKEQRKQ